MDRLELGLLGAPRVSIDGRKVDLRTRKSLALLVYLATEGGMHRRDKLAEFLWPRSTGGRGRTALRGALSGIRRGLKEGATGPADGFLKVEGDLLGVEAGPGLRLDLDVLREASGAVRASRLSETNGRGLVSTLRSADRAYRGEFLEGFGLEDAPEFDLWVEAQRSLWRAQLGEILGPLAELEAEAGELAAAAETAQRWVARDPMEESARVRLMEARSAAGDPGGALAASEEYRSEPQGFGIDQGPETEALHASIQTQLAATHREEGRSAPGSLRMPFVGRETDFGALVEEYRAARSGAVRSVVILGEAGIGKTRLAEEFLGWAASRGADTLRGRTFKAETSLPYETLVDALRPRLERERAPDDLLEDRWLSELSRILPELRDRYPDLPALPTADEASARALLFEALARLGSALAGGSPRRSGTEAGEKGEPLVLFVDDLQWSDGATLDALGYACRSWGRDGVPLLLMIAAREEDLRRTNLDGWLSSLERELAVRRLALAPMNERDVHSLLRLIVGITDPNNSETRQEGLERVGRWLREESEGHPLFLGQILGLLLERGVLVERTSRDGRREIVLSGEGFDEGALREFIPAGLRELILVKLRPLSDNAKAVLTAGAVLGRDFGFDELVRVSGVGEAEGIAVLDELVSIRLLEETGTPSWGGYSFAHDKIREVAYTEAGEARRGVFHRRALEALEDRGTPAAELARHALAARFPEKAFGYLLAAAEEAMSVFAAGDAIGYYERARDLLEDRPWGTPASDNGVPERLRLYGGLARSCTLIHDWERARGAYERMLAVARGAGAREAEWEALHGLGALAVGFTVGPGDDELLRGVRQREGSDHQTTGTAVAAESGTKDAGFGDARSPRVARRYAERSVRVARELGRGDLILRSEFGLGVACTWTAEWEELATHLEEALSILAASGGEEEMDDHSLVQLVWCKGLVAWSRGLVDGPDGAYAPTGALRNMWKKAAEVGEVLGTDYGRAQMGPSTVGLAMVGEYEEALRKGTRGLEASRSLGHPQFAAITLQGLGDAYRGLFSLEAARSAYSEMLGWVSFSTHEKEAHDRLCAVASLEGEWDLAYEHALEASGLEKDLYLPFTYLHHHHYLEALLRGGDAKLAGESLRAFESRTGGQKGYFRLAYLRSAAVLARWGGDTNETLSLLREALGLAERLCLPGEIWQVGATLGEVYEERGEIGPSGRTFAQAAAVVHKLAAKISDQGLREGYLTAPQTRRVLEKARA